MIATTRDIRESELLASAEAAAAISDDGLRCKTAVDQFQQPDAPGYSIAMLIPTEQVAEGRSVSIPTRTGSEPWKISSCAPIPTADRSYCWLIHWA